MEKGFVVAFIALLSHLLAVEAQLDLFITKRDVNSYLKLNFDLDLYLIKDNEPVTLLKDSRGFYDFMSPLQSTVNGVKLSWFSSPQSTKYSLKLSSSDHEIVRNPVASIQPQGVVPHSVVSFFISLDCTGKKGGMVDVSMQLNYTKIVGTSVNSSSQKTLFLQVKKLCEKTVKDKETQPKPVHWSRGAIVGLSAGITVFLCLCVGLVLLFKHYMKQRKLKMEFEDDLDLEDKRQFCLKKVTSLPVHRLSSGGPKSPPQILYSPKRVKIKVPRQRQRSETNGSDTSTLELICKEECDDDKQQGEETTIKDGWSDRVADVLLNAEHLEIKEQIGTGACGDVYHGFLKELKDNNISEVREVSVEVYRGGKEDEVSKQLLVAAIHQAKEFNHPNIIKPIGVVLNPTVQVVTPYMEYTTLNDFLRQHSDTVSHKQLMTIAINIANALEFLNQNNIHKGLSSKECMIDENGDVKISTFHNTTNTRWMAPECFTSGLYSEKSDVWSFGVMLWQMTTHGELPYPEIHTDELFNYLQSGNRLQQNCSNHLYSVMLLCWSLDPISRPTLHWLIDWLNTYVQSLDTNSQMLV